MGDSSITWYCIRYSSGVRKSQSGRVWERLGVIVGIWLLGTPSVRVRCGRRLELSRKRESVQKEGKISRRVGFSLRLTLRTQSRPYQEINTYRQLRIQEMKIYNTVRYQYRFTNTTRTRMIGRQHSSSHLFTPSPCPRPREEPSQAKTRPTPQGQTQSGFPGIPCQH
jgi:hypothetical protein